MQLGAHRRGAARAQAASSFCDRVLYPSGCIQSGCPYLYLYDDEATGRRFGRMHKVFRGEIDVELFEQAERTRQVWL